MPLSPIFIQTLCQHLELSPEQTTKILAQSERAQLDSLRIELCILLSRTGDPRGDKKTGEKVFGALMFILQDDYGQEGYLGSPPFWLVDAVPSRSVPHLLTATALNGYWESYNLKISAFLLLKLLNIAMRQPTESRVEEQLISYFITDWSDTNPETKIKYLADLPVVDYVINYYRMLASQEDTKSFHAERTAIKRITIPYGSWYEVIFRLIETLIQQQKITIPPIWHHLINEDRLPNWHDMRRKFLFLADNYGTTGYPDIAKQLRSIIITTDSQKTLDLVEFSRKLARLYCERILPSSATPQPRIGLFTIYERPKTPQREIETARAKQHALIQNQQLFLDLLNKYLMISFSGHLPDTQLPMSAGAKTLAENLLKITLTRHARKQDMLTPITQSPPTEFLAIQAQLDRLRAHLLYKNIQRKADYDSPAERKQMLLLAIKEILKHSHEKSITDLKLELAECHKQLTTFHDTVHQTAACLLLNIIGELDQLIRSEATPSPRRPRASSSPATPIATRRAPLFGL
ncbi:MAG: hypothetical protein A3C55_03070 [Gammaproteobacteria bacterium RIFCSPHIGHO2_02_FULL_42_13]|nr:MAG: hypothetical protein A3C55_03070 [Gammaproteobacteria bacterium RIFCSPHIGHO2_02_FULL_42_13]OGT67846.1 MAG: hypothetical protein A3H43_04585 [Gammaproteobacteria bacterium RIFCSPLOWO2_02_FULL_42_9]